MRHSGVSNGSQRLGIRKDSRWVEQTEAYLSIVRPLARTRSDPTGVMVCVQAKRSSEQDRYEEQSSAAFLAATMKASRM